MPGSPLTLTTCWWCGHTAQSGPGGHPLGMAMAVRDHDPTGERPGRDITWECLDHRACMRRVMARVARVN